jgi:hypothetical protein
VGFFRRESLHERLAREGGLQERRGTRPAWDQVGIHGIARPRQWDFLVTAEAPDLRGDQVELVALPDGTLLVAEGSEEGLDPLAAVVEQRLPPPYRALAVKQVADLWAVSARGIQVARFESQGERLELTKTAEGRSLVVDGMPSFGTVPVLEELGDAAGDSYAIHAERLDADLWEVKVSAL